MNKLKSIYIFLITLLFLVQNVKGYFYPFCRNPDEESCKKFFSFNWFTAEKEKIPEPVHTPNSFTNILVDNVLMLTKPISFYFEKIYADFTDDSVAKPEDVKFDETHLESKAAYYYYLLIIGALIIYLIIFSLFVKYFGISYMRKLRWQYAERLEKPVVECGIKNDDVCEKIKAE